MCGESLHLLLELDVNYMFRLPLWPPAELNSHLNLPVTDASVEGMNRKAGVVSRRSCGFRTAGTFQLALYHLPGDLPMPETTRRFL